MPLGSALLYFVRFVHHTEQGGAAAAHSSIEARLQRLEDIESVRRLMATYHQLCDGWTETGTHKNPAGIASLFTEDGEWAVMAR